MPHLIVKGQMKAHEIHHGKGLGDASVSPQFRGRTPWGWSGASHLSFPSTNLTKGLAARRLFKVSPCREGTMHLQTSMSSPGFEPSPNGTAVSVANHYTGWVTMLFISLLWDFYVNSTYFNASLCSRTLKII
ncbi:uncharacterized protein TNCV_1788481 [Trichonephila clavipes]|nr:uncharacterized protein TNCV_1788481 [Trichonephila clavipes]